MLQHVLLLPETKGSCARVLLITAYVSDYAHMHKLCRLQTEKPMPSYARNQLQETRKTTR